MTPTIKLLIDDELLAAYLDGQLEGEQEEYVENAIENSPELQWTVDRWIEMQICQDKVEPTDVESIEPLVKEKVAAIQKSPDIEEEKEVAAIRKLRISRIIYMAASILLLIGISLPLLIKQNKIGPKSGMPMDFPAGELVPMEYQPESGSVSDVVDSNNTITNDDALSCRYVIYKSVIIVMWEERMDRMEFDVYASDGRKIRNPGFTTYSHSMVVPTTGINESDKPIWIAMKFYNPGFYYADSIMINF